MKRFVSLFCILMLAVLPFAWAETQVEFLSQQAVPAPASLPDLQPATRAAVRSAAAPEAQWPW